MYLAISRSLVANYAPVAITRRRYLSSISVTYGFEGGSETINARETPEIINRTKEGIGVGE